MNTPIRSAGNRGSSRSANTSSLSAQGGGKENSREHTDNFQALYEESLQDFREGRVIAGEVVKIEKGTVFVDIGYKSEGEVALSEFRDSRGNIAVKHPGERAGTLASASRSGKKSRSRSSASHRTKKGFPLGLSSSFPIPGRSLKRNILLEQKLRRLWRLSRNTAPW